MNALPKSFHTCPPFTRWLCAMNRSVARLNLRATRLQDADFSSAVSAVSVVLTVRFIAQVSVFLVRYRDVFVVKE